MTNLLVVDDESATRRLVAYTLKSMNVEVIGAETSADAIQLARENVFGMILLDINLPGMDGFTLLALLRSLPHLSAVPIIMFTARSNPSDEMRASELGANGFLYKPFTTQELRSMVTEYLA
jgi:DNA-binding response OmpR family regulator